MIITNPNNLPDSLVLAVTPEEREINFNRMSVTDLVGPPMIRHLKLTHWHEMSERVDDRVWLMLGTAFHKLMDSHSTEHSEEKIEVPFGDMTLVGVPDVWKDGILYDYKVTSVWSWMAGTKEEWIAQLNVYNFLLRSKGVRINGIKIIAILRDWIEKKAYEADYPDSALKIVDIPMWSMSETEAYIKDRLILHRSLQPCTEQDKWTRPTTYAVKVKDAKKALRVLPTELEAEVWGDVNAKGKKWFVEERLGESARCKTYCAVAAYCQDNPYKEAL